MTSQKVYAHNVLTDVIKPVPAHYLTHPVLGANLREVPNGKTRGRLSEIVGRVSDAPSPEDDQNEEAPGPPTEPTIIGRLEEQKED